MSPKPITHLFTDLGGVLLTNGWDHDMRRRTAEHFGLDAAQVAAVDDRHHLTFDAFESGKMTFDDYLDQTYFFAPRSFTRQQLIDFILGQAQAFPEMIDLVRRIKARHGLKVGVVSNEGREIAADRVRRFGLHEIVDFFVLSGFVHLRKPDLDIFRLALDLAQVEPGQVVYLEDRSLFVDAAARVGLRAIWHQGYESTRERLAACGLTLEENP